MHDVEGLRRTRRRIPVINVTATTKEGPSEVLHIHHRIQLRDRSSCTPDVRVCDGPGGQEGVAREHPRERLRLLFLSKIRVWLRNLRFDVLPPLPQGCFHILGELQFFLGQVVFLAGIVF